MIDIDWQGIVAVLALGFSAYTFRKTHNVAEKQAELLEDQKRLNRLLLDRAQEEAVSARRADMSANLVKMAKGCKVKIFNRGNVEARNIRIIIPKTTTLFIETDVKSKFPLERLEPGLGVELLAVVHMNSDRKQSALLMWDDDYADNNEKTVFLIH